MMSPASAPALAALADVVLEHLADGVLVVCEDEVVLANRELCRLAGVQRDDLVGAAPPPWVPRTSAPVRDVEVDLGTGYGRRRARPAELSSATCDLPDGTRARIVTVRDRSAQAAREAELVRLADRDGLTGLLNKRSFDARVAEAAERLARNRRPLGLIVLDLDHFKAVNDEHGHPVGDRVLAEAAERLAQEARAVDSVGRIGGEEFAWLLPDASEAELLAAAERLSDRIASMPFAAGLRLTASIGICDLAAAGSAEALMQRADEALYWAKALGRDAVLGWSGLVAARLACATEHEPVREDAVNRLIAVADDADTTPDRGHGRRVADLAVALAAGRDWSPDRQARLHLAARIHDVGKAALPHELLRRTGALSRVEAVHIGRHAQIGAALAADVLDGEQTRWIRHHHDRWDAGGDELPDGARILAIADAWDAMTTDRPYRTAMSAEDALAELDRGSGGQFCPGAGDLLRGALAWWSAA